MKRRHLLLVALSLILTICMCFSLAACGKKSKAVQLDTPVVTVSSEGVAEWKAVEHASGYAYKVDNGDEVATDKTSVTLTEGQSIVVKAVGDGKDYSDSGWSQAKTYTKPSPSSPTTLATPVVVIGADGTASWSKITGASLYVYKINDGDEKETTALSVKLNDGDAIQVKAVGDGTTYYDSGWSAKKIYDANTFEPVQLDKPVVSVDENGLASWAKVTGATSYAYIINGAEQKMTSNLSVQLENVGDKIKVQALGDPNYYTASEWSDEAEYVENTVPPTEPQPLAAPVISINGTGLVTWNPVPHADGYVFLKNGTEGSTNACELQLKIGETLKVKAVSEDEMYEDSDWSNEVTYTGSTGGGHTCGDVCPECGNCLTDCTEPECSEKCEGHEHVLPDTDFPTTEITVLKALTDLDSTKYYTIGFVKSFTDSTSYCNFYIQDEEGNELYIYGLCDEEGKTIYMTEAKTLIQVGDAIVLYGPVSQYQGTNQMANAWLVQINDDAKTNVAKVLLADLTGVPTSVTADFELPTADGKVSWAVTSGTGITIAEGSNLAKVTRTSEEQTAVLTATAKIGDLTETKPFTVKVRPTVPEGVGLVFDFTNTGSTQQGIELTASTGLDFLNSAANTDSNLVSVAPTKVYAGNGSGGGAYEKDSALMKMGTGSADGVLVLTFSKPVSKVTINSVAWPGGKDTLTVNGSDAQTQSDTKTNYVFTLSTPSEVVTITAGHRSLVFSIAIEFAGPTTQPLDVPEVGDIDVNGNVTWSEVDNASGYEYVIIGADGVDGEIKSVEAPITVTLKDGESIKVRAVGDGVDYAEYSDWSAAKKYVAPKALGVPVLGEIDLYGNVTWGSVANAIGYEYSLDGGESVRVDAPTTVKLADGQKIKVRAVGDGTVYAEYSDWSAEKTYTKQVQNLDTLPSIHIAAATGNAILDAAVEHATKFVYQIKENGSEAWGEEVEIAVSEITAYPYTVFEALNDGDSIRIRAVGDEIYVFPADKWTETTYTAPVEPVAVEKPTVTVDRGGKVTWTHTNTNVTVFKYYIGENLTAESLEEVVWLTPDGDVVLESGKSIAVIACKYSEMTLDSEATIVSYVAPGTHEAIDSELVDFEAVEGEDGKVRIIWAYNEGSYTFEIELTDESGTTKLTTQEEELVIELKDYTAIVIRVAQTDGAPTAPDFDYSNYKNASADLSILAEYNEYYDEVKKQQDEAKVAAEKAVIEALDLPETVSENTEISLPVNGTTYTDVEIEWDIDEDEAECAEITEDNKLKIDVSKVPAEGATIKLVAWLSINDALDFVEFEIKVKAITEVSFNFVGAYENDKEVPTESKSGVTLTLGQGTHSSSKPKYYSSGTAIRFYAGNTLTVSAEKSIKKIVFASGEYLFVATASTGAFVDLSTWKGEATEIVFSASVFAGQNHSRISTMTVYFGSASDEDNAEIAIALIPALQEEYIEDFELDTVFNGLTVTWTAVAEEVEGAGSITFEGGKATVVRGTVDTTVTVTASVSYGDGLTKTKDFSVKVPKQLAEGEKDEVKLYTLVQKIGGDSGYATASDINLDDGTTWNVAGNSQQNPWRFGGKSITNQDRALSGKTAIEGQVTKVLLTASDGGSITVNSISLKVYAVDPTSSGAQAISTKTARYSKDTEITFTADEGEIWLNCFYQIVFNVTVGSDNKYATISSLVFYGYEYEETDENKVALAKNSLQLDKTQYDEVEDAIQLPNEAGDVTLTWKVKDAEQEADYVTVVENVLSIKKLPDEGEYEITLIVELTLGDASDEKEFVITLISANAKGTLNNPYSITEAVEIAKALSSTDWSSSAVYATGYVVDLGSWFTDHFGSVVIADSPTSAKGNSDAIIVYNLYPDGVYLKVQADLAIGATITVYGYLKNYNGNTPEFDTNNSLQPKAVAYAGPTDEVKVTLALSQISKISEGKSFEANTFELETAINGIGITWSANPAEGVVSITGGTVTVLCSEKTAVTITATAACSCGEVEHHTRSFNVFVKTKGSDEVPVQTKEIVLTADALNFNSKSYAENNGDHAVDGITFNSNQVYLASGKTYMQWQKNTAAAIYNKTALGNGIVSITIVFNSSMSSGTLYCAFGDSAISENPNSAPSVTMSGTKTFEPTDTNYAYFRLYNPSATCYIDSITIVYATADGSGSGGGTTDPVDPDEPPSGQLATVTMKSTLTGGNMSTSGNNASSVNLDSTMFNVSSSGGSPAVGTYSDLRMYASNVLTVKATGAVIVSIKITFTSGYQNAHTVKAGTSTVTADSNASLVEVYTINADTFSITNTGSSQVRIVSIEITYQVNA